MDAPQRPSEGCFVSAVTGFILTFLAVLLAVGAGILVYLIRPPGHVTCQCNCPSQDINGDIQGNNDIIRGDVKNSSVTYEVSCGIGNCSTNSQKPSPSQQETSKTEASYRLPKSLLPVLYELEIKPNIYSEDPVNFTFEGHVKILINCSHETKNITLHMNEIVLVNDSISLSADSKCSAPGVTHHEQDMERQFLILFVNEALRPGCQYNLTLSFNGRLTDGMNGLFYSSYQRSNSTSYLAATFFSPIDARKAFPCFDEPQLKARFIITVVRKPEFLSLSNMDVSSSKQRPDGFVADVYDKTPLMSTYLVAFIVCDFEYRTGDSKYGNVIRLWTPRGLLYQGDFALENAVKLLVFFTDYLGISYSLPKLDLVAVPDYQVKGMENWGLITFQESSLLFDPKYQSLKDKAHVVQVLAHEISHLWFGDLVTMEWWSELWLKEGFASYLEYIALEHVFSEWKIMEQFVMIDLYTVFAADSLGITQPIVQPAQTPSHIQMLFNYIPYSKGSCMMRMMTFMFGEKTYQSALNVYLQSKAYGSSTRKDLWSALQQNLPPDRDRLNVTDIMETWVLQKHYPVVTVIRNGSTLVVTQQKFRSDAQLKPEDTRFGYRWEVPFTYTTSQQRDFNHRRIVFLKRNDSETIIQNIPVMPATKGSNSWVIGNIQQYGYYRVNYDAANWKALIGQLKMDHTVIPPVHRAQIINDAWNLAKAGMLDQRLALETVEYLKAERDSVPWRTGAALLHRLGKIIDHTKLYGKFKEFMRRALAHLFSIFTWETDIPSLGQELLRVKVITLACHYGLKECVHKAKEYFQDWMKNKISLVDTVTPSLRSVVYRTAVSQGGVTEWEFVYQQYKTSDSVREKDRLRLALAASRDTWILNKYLEMAVDPSEVSKQDVSSTIVAISENPVGRSLVWDFITTRWEDLTKVYGARLVSLSTLVIHITQSYKTMAEYQKLTDFIFKHPEQAAGSRALMQAVEEILANIHWLKLNENLIADWLDEQLGKSSH